MTRQGPSAPRRGMGRIYLRGKIWWVQTSFRGVKQRESSHSTRPADAVRLLKRRLGEIEKGIFGAHRAEQTTLEDLVALIKADYEQKQNRTWDRVEHSLKHLRPEFGRLPAVAITYDRVSRYISKRIEDGAARGTIHHEVAALNRMFTLGVTAGRLHTKPRFPLPRLDNVRKGFFTDEEVRRVISHLPEWYAPAIEFGWLTSWRSSEVKGLTWSQVDFRAGTIRLEPGTTKNREGRTFPFNEFPQLDDLLRRQRERTLDLQRLHGQIIPWVFWKDGRQLGDHRDTWVRACRLAGVPGRLVHDLRRSAVRNLERAGVPRSVAMKLTGHKTELIYRRYAISSEADLSDGTAKLGRFLGGSTTHREAENSRGSRGTGTVRAQSAAPTPFETEPTHDDRQHAATGTHGLAVDSGAADLAAPRPATHPVDHAHWKLYSAVCSMSDQVILIDRSLP